MTSRITDSGAAVALIWLTSAVGETSRFSLSITFSATVEPLMRSAYDVTRCWENRPP